LTYIFDACALMALFKKEKGADKIDALIKSTIYYFQRLPVLKRNMQFHWAILSGLQPQ